MTRLPRTEATELAERSYEAMHEPLVQVVTDLLAGPDQDELGADLRARVERAAARMRMRMRMEWTPPRRRQKG